MKIVVVGIPGAGKTTILNHAATKYNVDRSSSQMTVLLEPVEKWEHKDSENLLGKFFRDYSTYVYPLQLKVLHDLLMRDACIRRSRSNRIYLCERDVYSCIQVFVQIAIDNGFMVHEITDVLLDLCNLQPKEHDICPDLYVYVKTPPEVALERIRSRNRPDEYNFYCQCDAKYLRQLFDRHEELFSHKTSMRNVPIVELNGLDPVQTSYHNLMRHITKNC